MSDFVPPSDPPDGNQGRHPPAGNPPDWAPEPSPAQWGADGQASHPQSDPYGHDPADPYGSDPYGQDPYGHDPYAPQPADWGQPYHQAGYQQGYGYGYGYPTYPRQSTAVAALILSLVGIFICGIPSVVGMVMGKAEMNAIGRGESDPSNHGMAQAAFIVGLVITLLFGAVLAFYLVAIFAAVAGGV